MPDQMTIGAAALEVQTFRSAPMYVWRDDLLDAALGAAISLPAPVTFKRELMPTESGVYLLGKDVLFDGVARPIRAIAWGCVAHLVFFWVYISTKGTSWSQMGPLGAFASFGVADGVDVVNTSAVDARRATEDGQFDIRIGSESVVRFVLASWLWFKQRVMCPRASEVNRVAKKAAARAAVNLLCNVVVLRRSEASTGVSSVDAVARDYSCQWLVGGHWRQQYYPSTNEHRPIWIEPYVKGPEDKPFRAPAETVFAVAR
jgi:hypothetical protein